MRLSIKRALVLVVAAAGFCAMPATAAPVTASHIDADAKWYGHVDLDAVRTLPLVREWIDKVVSDPAKLARIEEVTTRLGIDPVRDVGGITVYATRYEDKTGAALVYVRDADAGKLEAALKAKHPDAASESYNSHTIFTWQAKACRGQGTMPVTGSIARNDIIVVGDAASVRSALDVLDRTRQGLLNDSPLVAGQTENVLFAGRAQAVPAEFRQKTKSPVARVMQAGEAIWTQKDDQITGRYEVTTETPEQAASFKSLADGFKAMALVKVAQVPAARQLLEAVTINADGTALSLTWTGTTQDIDTAAKAIKAQAQARREARAAAK